MILWNNTKAAVAAVLTMAIVIGGVGAAVHAVAAQRSPRSRTVTAANAAQPPAVITFETQNVLLAVSPDRRELAGFSIETGQWQAMPQPPRGRGNAATAPAAPTIPPEIQSDNIIVAENVGAYRNAERVYGFSGLTGKWDSVAVNTAGEPKSGIIVAQNVAAYADGNRVHAFSALTGTWDTLTVAAQGNAPQPSVTSITVTLRHEKAFYMFSAKTGKWTEPPFQEKE